MKAIYALMGASVLMIVFGLFLIMQQPPVEEETASPSEPAERNIGLIPVPSEDAGRDSDIPQLEVEAEPGTEPWCEQMMNQSNEKWSREDSQVFADNCIYE